MAQQKQKQVTCSFSSSESGKLNVNCWFMDKIHISVRIFMWKLYHAGSIRCLFSVSSVILLPLLLKRNTIYSKTQTTPEKDHFPYIFRRYFVYHICQKRFSGMWRWNEVGEVWIDLLHGIFMRSIHPYRRPLPSIIISCENALSNTHTDHPSSVYVTKNWFNMKIYTQNKYFGFPIHHSSL